MFIPLIMMILLILLIIVVSLSILLLFLNFLLKKNRFQCQFRLGDDFLTLFLTESIGKRCSNEADTAIDR